MSHGPGHPARFPLNSKAARRPDSWPCKVSSSGRPSPVQQSLRWQWPNQVIATSYIIRQIISCHRYRSLPGLTDGWTPDCQFHSWPVIEDTVHISVLQSCQGPAVPLHSLNPKSSDSGYSGSSFTIFCISVWRKADWESRMFCTYCSGQLPSVGCLRGPSSPLTSLLISCIPYNPLRSESQMSPMYSVTFTR